MIICIWCEDKNRGIGKNNSIPWHIKEDLIFFKKTTLNSIVIMGRKTYDSIGKKLPNRTNIILSRSKNNYDNELIVINDYNKIIDKYKFSKEKVFIIGGKQIYDLFINDSYILYVSKIKHAYDCDVFMNNNYDNFEVESIEKKYDFDIYTYKNKNINIK